MWRKVPMRLRQRSRVWLTALHAWWKVPLKFQQKRVLFLASLILFTVPPIRQRENGYYRLPAPGLPAFPRLPVSK